MIGKQIFKRLTIVLAAPLLALGWWLADSEVLFPRQSIIYCDEFASHISCLTSSATERDAAQHGGNGAVRLSGARLSTGFNHMVVAQPLSESKIVDGKWVVIPPTNGGVRKSLRLPPASKGDITFASCELSPFADSAELWNKSCIGYEAVDENFTFVDENENQKFRTAFSEIQSLTAANEKRMMWSAALLLMTPLIAYLALMAALVLFARVVRYVVYGRRLAKASSETAR